MTRSAPSIDAYGEGGFRLSGERRQGSVLILSDEPRTWDVTSPADLTVDSLGSVIEAGRGEVEFLLLGMGSRNAMPPREVRDALQRSSSWTRRARRGSTMSSSPRAADWRPP
jgi:uncharacterized protein